MWCTGPDPHMCVVYRTRPSYVCGVQDQTIVRVWCTGPDPRMCMVYRTRLSYVFGVQDQTLKCVVYRTRPSYVCGVQDQTFVHVQVMYHDCVRVGILCIKITPPLHAHGGFHTQGPSVPACLFLSLPSPRPPAGCTPLLACTEDVGSVSLLRVAYRFLKSLPGVLHTRTFTVAMAVCCILHIRNSVHVYTYVRTYLVLPTKNACTYYCVYCMRCLVDVHNIKQTNHGVLWGISRQATMTTCDLLPLITSCVLHGRMNFPV